MMERRVKFILGTKVAFVHTVCHDLEKKTIWKNEMFCPRHLKMILGTYFR